jgi:predicted DNA-binding WGR domain protein
MKAWGRIGARGHLVGEPYDTEALAAAALQRQAERKKRRGYVMVLGDLGASKDRSINDRNSSEGVQRQQVRITGDNHFGAPV